MQSDAESAGILLRSKPSMISTVAAAVRVLACLKDDQRKERMMELWDLYNEKRELTGMTHVRGQKVPQGF